jgi:hypothetical protein
VFSVTLFPSLVANCACPCPWLWLLVDEAVLVDDEVLDDEEDELLVLMFVTEPDPGLGH